MSAAESSKDQEKVKVLAQSPRIVRVGDMAELDLPDINVVEIRRRTGLSQSNFAKSIGVAKGTLLNWEHGRRHPTGPAQVLLALISRRPSVVQELLR